MWKDFSSGNAARFKNLFDILVHVTRDGDTNWVITIAQRDPIHFTLNNLTEAKQAALAIFHEMLRDTLGEVKQARVF